MSGGAATVFALPSGEPVPRLGQGAWQIGEDRRKRAEELNALRLGIELGMTLIDTAEMYGNGRSEQLVADVIAGQRERVYLVSKVLRDRCASDQHLHRLPSHPCSDPPAGRMIGQRAEFLERATSTGGLPTSAQSVSLGYES